MIVVIGYEVVVGFEVVVCGDEGFVLLVYVNGFEILQGDQVVFE